MEQQQVEMSPSRVWRFATAAGVSALFLVLDQITKAVVRNLLVLGAAGPELIPGVIRLVYVQNIGAAFSLGEGLGGAFVLLALLVIAATLWYLWRTPLVSHLEVVGLAMVVGGAVGNAIDRLVSGYVVDFFATEFIDFPVANKVDATAELNRRDAEARARRDAKRASRKSKRDVS